MKEKIIKKAGELFLKLGFKSITMDDIAGEMCISKKTIYKYFCNKELLVEESTNFMHIEIHETINTILAENRNPIEENFRIREMFSEMFQSSADTSPVYQLKKHYPEIYDKVIFREITECSRWFRTNIIRGIENGLYRKEIDVEAYVQFYYTLIFNINENTSSERESQRLELQALEYHTRAMSTAEGIIELEKQLQNTNTK
ncbi:TetR/AcrR family transcriptional regulator [Flavobacterium algicola]|uniref:TetR/AcrR family transcriptional regulator n=1 Tax=Flavobacterium algicola TaxID=556529 RepID=UPI001EFD8A17|nr:TetR/AcrR family transcriptional regulator [Flavobacterium algicola]MCG9791700.1 TetR/AcrR family transcriptional regulator [Flavobacterium algicola]